MFSQNKFYNKYFWDFYPQKNLIYNKFIKNVVNNYELYETHCECNIVPDNDILLLEKDRHNYSCDIVICKNCGIIRQKKYFLDDDLSKIYNNDYRKYFEGKIDKKLFFNNQYLSSLDAWKIIEQYCDLKRKKLKICDLGGGAGGFLKKHSNYHDCYLVDFDKSFFNIAKNNNINSILGDSRNIIEKGLKFDLIILSHVVEHFNSLKNEFLSIEKICKPGSVIFIEVPGVDSIKKGRRYGEFLGDVQIFHKYYFTSYTLSNFLQNFNFKVAYSDSVARLILIYSPKIENTLNKNLNNIYLKVIKDVNLNIFYRFFYRYKIFIGSLLPKSLKKMIKKIIS